MVSSGMLRLVALVSSSETAVLSRATRRNIPEDTIFHSHRRENLKYYKTRSVFECGMKGNPESCTFLEFKTHPNFSEIWETCRLLD
jgi:hypothetical protein